MESLPSELLLKIFSHVPWLERIKTLEAVCKRWNELLRYMATPASFPTCRSTCIVIKVKPGEEITCQLLPNNDAETKLAVKIKCPQNITADELEKLLTRIPAAHVALENSQIPISPYLKRHLDRRVRLLYLKSVPDALAFAKQFDKLKELILGGMVADLRDLYLPSLEALSFVHMVVQLSHLNAALQNCPGVSEVETDRCQIVGDEEQLRETCQLLSDRSGKLHVLNSAFALPFIVLPNCKVAKHYEKGNKTVTCRWKGMILFITNTNVYHPGYAVPLS